MGLTRFFKHPVILLAALAAAGCANLTPPSPEREALLRATALPADDTLEQHNRDVLAFNKVLNDDAISPTAHVYRTVLPAVVRDRIANGVSNLEEPRIFANDLLQLRFQAAATTLGRFIFNSTFGLAGTFDVASTGGLPKQTGDFGQTLYVWGVSSGPFLIAPIFGPTDLRDEAGTLVDVATDPAMYAIGFYGAIYADIGVGSVGGLEKVELLDDLEAGSIDFYGRLRSTYLQKRASQLGEAVGVSVTPQTLVPQTSPGPH